MSLCLSAIADRGTLVVIVIVITYACALYRVIDALGLREKERERVISNIYPYHLSSLIIHHSLLGTLGAGNHYCEIQVVDEIFDKQAAARMGIDQIGQVCIIYSFVCLFVYFVLFMLEQSFAIVYHRCVTKILVKGVILL